VPSEKNHLEDHKLKPYPGLNTIIFQERHRKGFGMMRTPNEWTEKGEGKRGGGASPALTSLTLIFSK
jgi:hypothetical protein